MSCLCMEAPRERIASLQTSVCSELSGLLERAHPVISPVPSADEDEAVFRKHMLAESAHVSGLHKDLAKALAACAEVEKAASVQHGDKLSDALFDLQRSATEVRDLTFYWVSLYAALTVYRNPLKGQDAASKLAGILDGIGKLTMREHWCGQPLLQEMRQSLVGAAAAGSSSGLPKRRAAAPESTEPAPAAKRGRGSGAGRGGGGRRGPGGSDGKDLRGMFAEGGSKAAAPARAEKRKR